MPWSAALAAATVDPSLHNAADTLSLGSLYPLSAVLLSFVVSFVLGLVSTLAAMRCCFPFWGTTTRKLREASSFMATGEEVKMTLVVRKDLKMGTGKVAAQCAHAAVAVVEELITLREQQQQQSAKQAALSPPHRLWVQWYEAWRLTGCSKVALQCPDEAAMMAIAAAAKEKALPFYVIRDAGRTQIAPGSKTVVAVGPGPKSLVDAVTGDLKLL